MMLKLSLILSVLLAALLPSATTRAQAQSAGHPRIVEVDHRFEMEPPAVKSASPVDDRMPKFMIERALTREVFAITWTPPAGGVEAGAVLLFEYRQKYGKTIKNLQVKYPFAVEDQRQSTFVIPGKNIKADGEVTAWRVRLVVRGRLLAEQKSRSWTS